jgi:hypothetical protein
MKMAKFGYLALCHVKSLSLLKKTHDTYKKRYRSCGKIDWIVLDVAPNITDEHASRELSQAFRNITILTKT